MAQSRSLDLVYVDGFMRGLLWDGMATTMVELGIDPPRLAHTMTDTDAGTDLTYYAGYRYVDTVGNRWKYSSLSALATSQSTNTTGVTFTHADLKSSLQSRVNGVQIFRSTGGQEIVVYQVFGVGFTATVSSVASNDGFAKFTTGAAHGFVVGDIVMPPSPYATEQVVTEVDSTTTFTTNAGYYATTTGTVTQRIYTFGHNGTITSSATSTGNVQFTVPAGHKLAVGARMLVAGHSVAGYNTTHVITAITATTIKTDQAYTADGTGGTWTLTGFAESFSDDDLSASTRSRDWVLSINNPDGSENARRFVPPPEHMCVVQFFQDRAVYGVVGEYTVGTLTTDGDNTVAGSGTAWPSDFKGRYLAAVDETRLHKITAVGSATAMTLERSATSSAAQDSYAVIPSPDEFQKIYFSEVDEPESVVPTVNCIIQDNTADADRNTAIAPMGAALFVYQSRHLYKVTFAKQPQIQANPTLVATRGCVNQRCWKQYEGDLYALDQNGAWRYSVGGGWEPISPNIQDIFRDGDLDWSKSRWWWCELNAEEETIRWFVNYVDSGYAKPNRALCYHLRYKAWWTEQYAHELSGGCAIPMSGRMRLLRGGQNEQIYLSAEGTRDGTTTTATHTATGGTTTTATGSSLGSTINASIAFLSGSNKGLARRITVNNGSTITFTPALTNAVASGDRFTVGGIPWSMRTGLLPFPDSHDVEKAELAIQRGLRLVYEPTSDTQTLDVRLYRDHATTPSTNQIATNHGMGITTSAGSSDAVLDVSASRSSLGRDSGTKWLAIEEGRLDPATSHNRWAAWELRGVQIGDRIEIYEIEALGVG
jgi:hypothetical protein